MRFAAILILMILLLAFISGCTTGNAEIILAVKTTSAGQPLPDVRVSLTPENDNFASRLQNTDANGTTVFTIEGGKYLISASKDGYATSVLDEYFYENSELTIELTPIGG